MNFYNYNTHTRRWRGVSVAAIALALGASAGCVELRAPDPDVRYVAFGDSTTKGPTPRDYPAILRELLGVPREALTNEGQGGETTSEGLERLSGLLEDGLFPQAETWFYWEGGNDIIEFIQAHDPLLALSPNDPAYPFADDLAAQLAQTQANIESAIAKVRAAGPDVYLTTYFFIREELALCPPMPLITLRPDQAERANLYVVRLNERIRDAATNQGAVLVDVAAESDALRSDAANYFDCNHLSVQGNEIVAAIFLDAITASTE